MVTAPHPSYDRPIEELNSFSIRDLIEDIKEKIFSKSVNGIRKLNQIFIEMNIKGNNLVD